MKKDYQEAEKALINEFLWDRFTELLSKRDALQYEAHATFSIVSKSLVGLTFDSKIINPRTIALDAERSVSEFYRQEIDKINLLIEELSYMLAWVKN